MEESKILISQIAVLSLACEKAVVAEPLNLRARACVYFYAREREREKDIE